MDPANRKAALVEATYHSIARQGFKGLRLRDVAAEVGIDHSTLHHYFPTKQDLIEAVVERATAPLHETIPEKASSEARLKGHLRILADLMVSEPDLFVVLAEIDLRARRDPKGHRRSRGRGAGVAPSDNSSTTMRPWSRRSSPP